MTDASKAPRIMVTESNSAVERQVEACGATVVRSTWSPAKSVDALADCDGLLITGGGDVNPALYGQSKDSQCYGISSTRDLRELALLSAARDMGMPVMGICRGLQIITVEAGGTLHQHIPAKLGHDLHSCDMLSVMTVPGSVVNRALGARPVMLHLHHQAIKTVPVGFQVTARHGDGTVEAIESTDGRVLAVQFHPESVLTTYDAKDSRSNKGWRIFEAFTRTCTRYRRRSDAKGRVAALDGSYYCDRHPEAQEAWLTSGGASYSGGWHAWESDDDWGTIVGGSSSNKPPRKSAPNKRQRRNRRRGSTYPVFKSARDSARVFMAASESLRESAGTTFQPPRNHGGTKGVLKDYAPVEAWCGPCGMAFDHYGDWLSHQEFFHEDGRRPTFALIQGGKG